MKKKEKNQLLSVEKKQIKNLFKEILPSINLKLFPHDSNSEKDVDLLLRNFFFFSVISDRLEIAKYFWKIGKV